MTSEELIADMNERIDKVVIALRAEASTKSNNPIDIVRIYGMAEGLLVVKDMLKGY